MNVSVTCRGGLHPPSHQWRLSIEHDWHRVKGRMQSAPTKLVCSLSEISLTLNSDPNSQLISNLLSIEFSTAPRHR
jgi:hypothetical protein